MGNKHDVAKNSLEQESSVMDEESIVRLQRKIEAISEEQVFLWELKQRDVQLYIREQSLLQENVEIH